MDRASIIEDLKKYLANDINNSKDLKPEWFSLWTYLDGYKDACKDILTKLDELENKYE